jgi:hypothetical protein
LRHFVAAAPIVNSSAAAAATFQTHAIGLTLQECCPLLTVVEHGARASTIFKKWPEQKILSAGRQNQFFSPHHPMKKHWIHK